MSQCGSQNPYKNLIDARVVLFFILTRHPFSVPKELVKGICQKIKLDFSHWLEENSFTCQQHFKLSPTCENIRIGTSVLYLRWHNNFSTLDACTKCFGPCHYHLGAYRCIWCDNV